MANRFGKKQAPPFGKADKKDKRDLKKKGKAVAHAKKHAARKY